MKRLLNFLHIQNCLAKLPLSIYLTAKFSNIANHVNCVVFIFLLFAGCKQENTSTINGIVMTIPYKIIIGKKVSQNELKRINDTIQSTFDEINKIYNKWNKDSELSLLNQWPANTPFYPSKGLRNFLERVNVFVSIDNQFDPTIEPLQALWISHLNAGTTPSEADLEALRPALGWDKLHFYDEYIMKESALTALDLGAIAKGLAVDMLTDRLVKGGFIDVYVDWGGEIKAHGRHPDNRPWTVVIFDPNKDTNLPYVMLDNQAIATSGDYFQKWKVGNREFTHVFDKKTLQPRAIKQGSITSASALYSNCADADALATILLCSENIHEARKKAQALKNLYPEASFWLVEAP